MLDASTVISKVSADGAQPQRLTLNPTVPEVIIDGGSAGASVAIVSGVALTAIVDNAFQPGAWSTVASPQAVAASTRRAIKMGGPNHVPLAITFS